MTEVDAKASLVEIESEYSRTIAANQGTYSPHSHNPKIREGQLSTPGGVSDTGSVHGYRPKPDQNRVNMWLPSFTKTSNSITTD